MRTVLALLVLASWIGAHAQGRDIYEEEFVTTEILDPLIKQPIVYKDLPFKCVNYRVETTGVDSKYKTNLLSYVQTSAQFDTKTADRTAQYIKESVCDTGNCDKKVRLPKADAEDPFYIILINARHTDPLLEAPADEPVTVKLTVKSCDISASGVRLSGTAGTSKTSESGGDENDDKLIIILVCTIGGFITIFSLLCIYVNSRHRYAENVHGYPQKTFSPSDNDAPLRGNRQVQEPDSPPGGIEDPVPPPAYEPPARDSPLSANGDFQAPKAEPVSAAPTRVFNNTLWGRLMSKRGSVKLQTAGTYAEREGTKLHVSSQIQDIESQAWPTPEGSNAQRPSSELDDGELPRPIFPEETQGTANKNVFFNSVFSRVRSGFQGSFKSFTSFGDRGDRNSGVKLKSITSMFKAKGKNVPDQRAGPAAISEGLERTSSDSTASAPDTPERLSVVEEDSHFPGAGHLDLSSDDENTSPFATPEVQTVAASYIHD